MARDKRRFYSVPYMIFMILFFILPLLILFYYAFTSADGVFSASNFIGFFKNKRALSTLVYSLLIALCTTALCLVIAYPCAYLISKKIVKGKRILLLLFIMPMWINFTLRITALKEILTLIEGNLAFHPFLNTVLGMTYDFLPFMILPIFNSVEKIDKSLIEASKDLFANERETILKVVIPLSLPGIMSGVSMVFLPAMTNYVVPDLVYNSTYIMGSLIGSYFMAYDWHNGSVVSLVLLSLILILTLLTGKSVEETR